jgi:hypothetical protein
VADKTRDPLDRERTGIASSDGRVTRDGVTLTLRTARRLRTFIDLDQCDDGPDECEHYHFQAHYPQAHAFLVYVTLYEGHQFLWIDDITGDVTTIGGVPHPSPSGRWMVVVEAMDCCGFDGLQLWSTEDRHLVWQHGGEFQDNRAYYAFRRWDGDDRVLLNAEIYKRNAADQSTDMLNSEIALVRSGAEWVLVEAPTPATEIERKP